MISKTERITDIVSKMLRSTEHANGIMRVQDDYFALNMTVTRRAPEECRDARWRNGLIVEYMQNVKKSCEDIIDIIYK